MSDNEKERQKSRNAEPPAEPVPPAQNGDRHRAAQVANVNGSTGPGASPLLGPEIPNADVDENGVFRFPNGDSEVFESLRFERLTTAVLFPEEKPIEWLWPERIPLGMVTFLEGAGSAGKTFVAVDMAARVTRGAPWPGRVQGPERAGDVLLLCGDPDGWECVILPRLKCAGADLTRIGPCGVVDRRDPGAVNPKDAYTERRPSFPRDLVMLEYNIRIRPETRLVVIDPLSAWCASDREYRETLRQLDEVAARRNVAIVVTARPTGRTARRRPPRESDRRADTVRSVFRVLIDPEDENLHHFAPVRTSFCAEPEWLPFQIGPKNAPAGQGMIAWGPPAEVPPESAVPPNPARERGSLRRSVMEWLRALLLKSDTPVTSVMREAKRLGYSESTVRRAREDLKVRMFRDEGGPCSSGWWTLRPKSGAPDPAPDWVPDAAALAGIQNWEGAMNVTPELADDVPETHGQAGQPELPPRPKRAGRGRNGRAGNGRKSHSRQDDGWGALAPLAEIPDILWERLRGPLLAAVLGTGAEGEESAGDRVNNGHSASGSDVLKRSPNGKRRKPKPK